MDTITHGIVGALVGKALFAGRDEPAHISPVSNLAARSSPSARVAIVACTLGSVFPDIDIFVGVIAHNPLAIMEWHRTVTHSIMMLPVWAFLLAALSLPLAHWLRWPSPSFFALAEIYGVGLVTHIFLDVVTNFGTMIWSPLKYSRAAWDWLFILDLVFTSVALVPQLASWCYRNPEKFMLRAGFTWGLLALAAFAAHSLAYVAGYAFSPWVAGIVSAIFAAVLFVPRIGNVGFQWRRAGWCRTGLALACLYLAGAAVMHGRALQDTGSFAARNHLHVQDVAALPLPPTLTHWAGVIATNEGVWRVTLRLPGSKIEQAQFYASDESDARVGSQIKNAKQLHHVQTYLWFARFPIWRVQKQDGQTEVEISDVRFFREDDPRVSDRPAKGFVGLRGNPAGFTFQIIFDAAGNVISQRFKR